MKVFGWRSILLGIILMVLGCNAKPRTDGDSIFVKASPNAKAYKDELARRIKSEPANLVYTFQKYIISQGKEYLKVRVVGSDFEATGLVLVSNWHKLEGIKQTKGLGYSGAELEGLEIAINENPAGAELIYRDLKQLVD